MQFILSCREYTLKSSLPKREVTPDLETVLNEFDGELQDIFTDIKKFPDIRNPELMPAVLLDIYLIHHGILLSRDFPGLTLSDLQKRKLAVLVVPLLRQKGTAPGIENAIRIILSIEAKVISPYNVDKWKIGKSKLGVDTNLFTTTVVNKAPLYNFNIRVFVPLTPELEAAIRIIAEFMKPIHTHLIDIVQDATVTQFWQIGRSKLGTNTNLAEE